MAADLRIALGARWKQGVQLVEVGRRDHVLDRATRFVPRLGEELGRKKGIRDTTRGLGLGRWGMVVREGAGGCRQGPLAGGRSSGLGRHSSSCP